MSSTPYLDAVLQHAPGPLLRDLMELVQDGSSHRLLIDSIVRLCTESPPPDWTSEAEWKSSQVQIIALLRQLNSHKNTNDSLTTKRGREDSNIVPLTSKKAKLDEISSVEDDPPIFTLHSISVSSPVRKKADVTVHRFTLRLTSPSNIYENLFPPIPIRALRLAFLVPTPGKSKPYLTAIIMSDTSSSADTSVIFGCDATAPAAQATTKYPDDKKIHPKGSSTKQLIHSLFAYFPQGPDGLVDLYEPKAGDFTSSSGSQSIDAFIGAKDGHLHFFKQGILWGERKPCMWFPVEEIRDVSTRSVTGRAFSLCIVTGANKDSASGLAADDNDDDPLEGEVLETTEFTLIDAKESDAVKAWIATRRQDFSKAGPNTNSSQPSGRPISNSIPLATASSKGMPLAQATLDESDPEDQEFALSGSDDDGSSESSDSSDDDAEDDQGSEGDAEAEDSEGDDAGAAGGSENIKAHGLRQPGAVPRMSKAAVDVAVGMVKEAFGMSD